MRRRRRSAARAVVAAQALAHRVSAEIGSAPGDLVGYQVRFVDRSGAVARLLGTTARTSGTFPLRAVPVAE